MKKRKVNKKTVSKAAKPAVTAPQPGRASTKTIRLLKMPAPGELAGHGLVVLQTLEEHNKKMDRAALIAALSDGRIQTTNILGVKDCFAMVRPKLLAKGYIAESD